MYYSHVVIINFFFTLSLIDTLIDHAEAFEPFQDTFPKCFHVGQAVSFWKEAANFQKTKVAD